MQLLAIQQCRKQTLIRIIHKFCLTNVLKTNRLSTTKIYFLLNSSVFCIKSYSIQSKRNEYILHNYFDLKHKHVSFINSCCTLKCCHLLTAFYIFEQQVELDKRCNFCGSRSNLWADCVK